MKREDQSSFLPIILTVLRILIGWHFLYEGFIKLAMPDWTSYHYLMESHEIGQHRIHHERCFKVIFDMVKIHNF